MHYRARAAAGEKEVTEVQSEQTAWTCDRTRPKSGYSNPGRLSRCNGTASAIQTIFPVLRYH